MLRKALVVFIATVGIVLTTGLIADAAGAQFTIRSGSCAIRLSGSSAAAVSAAGATLAPTGPATRLPASDGMGAAQPATGSIALDMQSGQVHCAGGLALTGREGRSIRFGQEAIDLATHTVRGMTTDGGPVTDLCTFQIAPSMVSATPRNVGVRNAACMLTPATATAVDRALGTHFASAPEPFALADATFDVTQIGLGGS